MVEECYEFHNKTHYRRKPVSWWYEGCERERLSLGPMKMESKLFYSHTFCCNILERWVKSQGREMEPGHVLALLHCSSSLNLIISPLRTNGCQLKKVFRLRSVATFPCTAAIPATWAQWEIKKCWNSNITSLIGTIEQLKQMWTCCHSMKFVGHENSSASFRILQLWSNRIYIDCLKCIDLLS